MHKKHHQLIDFLLKHQENVSAATLAKILNVTDRTIRNYIKEINESDGDIIITSSSQGYRINTDNSRMDPEWFESDEKELQEELLEFKIIQYLMNQSEYITYDEIADIFFYSPQTIRSRIQRLTMNIRALGIDVAIDTKVFKGIKLVGTEIQKRILLESFFTSISVKREMYKDFVINGFKDWVDADVIENVFKILDEINIKYQLNLEFLMYKKMSIQLIIILHQINHGHLVTLKETELTNLSSFKEFEVAKTFQSKLDQYGYVNMTDGELIFLVNYLISLQLDLDNAQIGNKNPLIMAKIEAILLHIEETYQVPTYSQKRFRNNISNHIYRIIYPASHNLFIYNPFVKETKSEYFFSFSIASNIALQIKKEFYVEIQDSEIAYLAYHIQIILDSRDKKKRKTIILYSRSYERTKLLASKIATYFDELEIYKIEKYSMDYVFDPSYLYIGINLAFEPQTNADFIMIQSGFQSSDIKKIRFFLEAQHSIIEQASIHWIHEYSPDDAICRLLSLNSQEHLYEPIMKRERMSYTSIGNLVAIPHPYFGSKEYKERVIIGVNKEAIQWGKELVQLIIIYIPSLDIERNEYAFAEFFQKTKRIEKVRELVQMTTEKEFVSRWTQI